MPAEPCLKNCTVAAPISIFDRTFFFFDDTAIADGDLLFRLPRTAAKAFDFLDDIHAFEHAAKDDVLSV